jgi:hypothetical protein
MTEPKSPPEGDDRPAAAIQQQHKLGLVFLESEAAASPWGRKLAQAATEFVRTRRRNRKKSHNKIRGLEGGARYK